MTLRQTAANNEKKDAHHWIYIEFASRRAHGNGIDARRDFFLVDVSRHSTKSARIAEVKMIIMFLAFLTPQAGGLLPNQQGNPAPPPDAVRIQNTLNIPPLPIRDFSQLILAAVLFSLALFLLFQAIAFLIWASKGDEDAPQAKAGIGFASISSIVVILIWVIFLYVHLENPYEPSFGPWLKGLFFDEPTLLVPPILIASVIPSTLALYKFVIANSFIRAKTLPESGYARPPIVALMGAAFTILQLAAAIVTLISYWSR